ncbi:hypothetical protein [Rhodopirellula sp. MGV]|uniref:hypothetical protein n=1 Tax=Rhodopirellula sp. MGV TaxID=2023130 RepID=UPI000B978652|nr:hypothetical protein [Rhodopirellula sp. MGV]PNY33935.1 hypothetical protein C2E31_26305 [Rhodopirellula baltica]
MRHSFGNAKRCKFVSIVVLIFAASFVPPASSNADDTPNDRAAEKAQRLKYLTELAGNMLVTLNEPASATGILDTQPVLRYSNPVRNFFSDGAVYLWRHDDQPILLGALSVRGNGAVFCEFATLQSTPLRCDIANGRPAWTPEKTSQVDVPLSVEGLPSANRQAFVMRRLIRRFKIQMQEPNDPDNVKELRLLNKPLIEWSDEKTNSTAMCFGFTETNDPEGLVIIKYNGSPSPNQSQWTYTLARMTSRPLSFYLDGQSIYEVKGYWSNPRSPKDSYLEQRLSEYNP